MAQIDIYDLYLRVLADINSQQGGCIKPYGNYVKWLYEISMELYKEFFDRWEDSQRVEDAMAIPFLKSGNVVVSSQSGRPYDIIAFPADYGHFSSARIFMGKDGKTGCACKGIAVYDGKTGQQIDKSNLGENSKYIDPDTIAEEALDADNATTEVGINKIDNSRWASALDNEIKPVTASKPIITQFSGGFKIAPKNVGIIILDYLKVPVVPVFAYTLDVDDNIVYDLANSVQIEWPATLINEIVKRLGKRFGKYVQDQFIYDASENERKIAQ